MKKMIGLMVRRPDLSPEEWRKYWNTTHAEITGKVPGLRSYVQNMCLPDENGDPPYDGVAVLAWDDDESMAQSLATPEWAAVMDDVPKFVDTDRASELIRHPGVSRVRKARTPPTGSSTGRWTAGGRTSATFFDRPGRYPYFCSATPR